jgi:hypothetical protein
VLVTPTVGPTKLIEVTNPATPFNVSFSKIVTPPIVPPPVEVPTVSVVYPIISTRSSANAGSFSTIFTPGI